MKTLILVLALVVTLQYQIATAGVLYVGSDGLATWPCGTSIANSCKNIATAVANANVYATTSIKVAQGDYAEQVDIRDVNLPASGLGQLTIEGGWNADFTTQSPDPTKTRITSSNDNAVINIAPGTGHRVGLRLAYLTLRGTTNLQRLGLEAWASQSTIDLDIEHCHVVSFRGQGISLVADTVGQATVTVQDTTLQGNYQVGSPWSGAGMYITSWSGSTVGVTLTKNTIVDNQAIAGGGIYLYTNGATLNATLVNNIMAGNQTVADGGAINAAAAGDSIMVLTMTNNTINNNQANSQGGGILLSSLNTATITAELTNTIVWGNNNSDIYINQNDLSTTTVTPYYSMVDIVAGVTSSYKIGMHNLHINPALNDSYHLTGTSPAKDKGLCGEIGPGYYERFAPYDDIDGNARPGWNVELGCDIGADEYRFPWILLNPVITKQQ